MDHDGLDTDPERPRPAGPSLFGASRRPDAAASAGTGRAEPARHQVRSARLERGGADRWTHAVDGRLAATGDAAELLSCEAWAPSWTASLRNGQPPDLYLGIASRDHAGLRFICLLAVATGIAAEDRRLRCAGTMADGVGAIVRARCTRPWGMPVGGVGLARAINDLIVVGLFKVGPIRETPSPALLEGDWETS